MLAVVCGQLSEDLAGSYHHVGQLDEETRRSLVDGHLLFKSGDPCFEATGIARDWPRGRGFFHNLRKNFLIWVNEEDHLRIISMGKNGKDVESVFDRLFRGIRAVERAINVEFGKMFMLDGEYGYLSTCPTNVGTGLRASVHVDLPGWTRHGIDKLKTRCGELALQVSTQRDSRRKRIVQRIYGSVAVYYISYIYYI